MTKTERVDPPAPILVLGLGNLLLCDDGAGLELLHRLEAGRGGDPRLEFVDGGTQGMALCGRLQGRRGLLMLDAAEFGSAPGTVHRIEDPIAGHSGRASTAHEANAGDLLAAASLLDHLPERMVLVGIEPEQVRTGLGLSRTVQRALPAAQALCEEILDEMLAQCPEASSCTS